MFEMNFQDCNVTPFHAKFIIQQIVPGLLASVVYDKVLLSYTGSFVVNLRSSGSLDWGSVS